MEQQKNKFAMLKAAAEGCGLSTKFSAVENGQREYEQLQVKAARLEEIMRKLAATKIELGAFLSQFQGHDTRFTASWKHVSHGHDTLCAAHNNLVLKLERAKQLQLNGYKSFCYCAGASGCVGTLR
jgi:hypothetical protein